MNESPRTPAPDFQDQLNALAEEMANGLGRQLAIDRLMDMGLEEEEADDQEASIREQLWAIHRGARAIFRDIENGLARPQAVRRFQELGLNHADAVQALDGFLEKKQHAQREAQAILEGVHNGIERTEAVARFRDLGLPEPIARQIVGVRFEVAVHWYTEQIRLGGIAAGIGAALLLLLASQGTPGVVAYLIPAGMLLYGLFFAVYAASRRRRAEALEPDAAPSPFTLVKRGQGRAQAIARAVELGMPGTEAALLLNNSLDAVARIYRWFVALGLAAVVLALYQSWMSWDGQDFWLRQSFGVIALLLWGGVGTLRGLYGWRCFTKI